MKQKNMFLLNYAIDIIIKLCYDITIKGKQKTFTPDADPGEREGIK